MSRYIALEALIREGSLQASELITPRHNEALEAIVFDTASGTSYWFYDGVHALTVVISTVLDRDDVARILNQPQVAMVLSSSPMDLEITLLFDQGNFAVAVHNSQLGELLQHPAPQ